jgi:hypothetical protein
LFLILFWKSSSCKKWYSRPENSPGLGLLVVALTENESLEDITSKRCLTTVVFPDPEGAEKIMSLFKTVFSKFQEYKGRFFKL